MNIEPATAGIVVEPRGFEELTGKYAQELVTNLSVGSQRLLFEKARLAWQDPEEKQIIRQSVSLQARRGLVDRAMDQAVSAVSGLSRIDLVIVTDEGPIYSLETGWDFQKQKLTIEGAKKYETREDARGHSITVDAVNRFLGQWLGH